MLRDADQGAQHPVRMSISVRPQSASMETSNVTDTLLADASNLSSPCRWFLQDNQTEPRVTAAGHLFHSIIPYAPAVPLLVCVFVFLSVFSLLANMFTAYIIERSDELSWLPRFVLCKSLILSDLLQTVTVAPAVLYSLLRHRTMTFSPWCFFQYAFGGASVFCSLTTITCMALERYLFVCFALQYTVIVTRERMRRLLALIWLYSISIGCISVALVLHARSRARDAPVTMGLMCEPDMMEQHVGSPRAPAVFRKVTGSLTLLLCFLVHAFSYFRMYRNASNSVAPFNESNTAARRTVLFYCGMLLLQLLPLLVKVASDALWEFGDVTARGARCDPRLSAAAAGFHVCLLVMLLVPPCINPLVYGLRSVELRKALAKMFRWRTQGRGGEALPREALPREAMRLRNAVHPTLPGTG